MLNFALARVAQQSRILEQCAEKYLHKSLAVEQKPVAADMPRVLTCFTSFRSD